MTIFATLGDIINRAYILFTFALGIWAGVQFARRQNLGGQYWGAMWTCTGLAVFGLLVWLARTLSGEPLRAVYILYELFFIIVLPGTFALLRGRDDHVAAGIFCAIAIFAALSAISAADPSRHVIAGQLPTSTITITPTP
jgi:hypothetical protein